MFKKKSSCLKPREGVVLASVAIEATEVDGIVQERWSSGGILRNWLRYWEYFRKNGFWFVFLFFFKTGLWKFLHRQNWPQIQRFIYSSISHVLGLNVHNTHGLGRNKCKTRTGKVHVKCSKEEDLDGLHCWMYKWGLSTDSRGDPSWEEREMECWWRPDLMCRWWERQ